MEQFVGAERRSGKATKRDCVGCVAKRLSDLVQPGFTTGGKWIHEIKSRSRLGLQPSQLFLLLPPTRCRRLARNVLAPLRRELRGVTADPPSLPPILSSPRESGSTLALQRLLQLPSYQTAWVLAANCGAPWRGTSRRCRRLRRLQCAQVSARRRDLGVQLFDEAPSVSYFGCNSRGSCSSLGGSSSRSSIV